MLCTSFAHRVYNAIAAKCLELRCTPFAVGGVSDHVHLLAALHATVPLATLIQEVKGVSSHLVTHELGRMGLFKWQGGYAAFSVSRSDLEKVRAYVLNQAAHHSSGQAFEAWEPEPAQAGLAESGAT